MGSERLVPDIDIASVQNVGPRAADQSNDLGAGGVAGQGAHHKDVKTVPSQTI
jgi:hypothetical protein